MVIRSWGIWLESNIMPRAMVPRMAVTATMAARATMPFAKSLEGSFILFT